MFGTSSVFFLNSVQITDCALKRFGYVTASRLDDCIFVQENQEIFESKGANSKRNLKLREIGRVVSKPFQPTFGVQFSL